MSTDHRSDGTLIAVAPAQAHTLLSTARACAAVGAGALIIPEGDRDRLRATVATIREFTSLTLFGQDGIGADLPSPRTHTSLESLRARASDALPHVLCGGELSPGVHGVACALTVLGATVTPLFGTVGTDPIPVLLAALAAGAHLRVGTADTPDCGLDDAQLVARASGISRLSARPPLTSETAKHLLVLNGHS